MPAHPASQATILSAAETIGKRASDIVSDSEDGGKVHYLEEIGVKICRLVMG
jgi:hypothetical protein